MSLLFKICGLKDAKHVKAAVDAGASYIGFVHYAASPRHVSLEEATTLSSSLPKNISSVCVCVDPDDALLHDIAKVDCFHYLQLHGDESPERLREIKSLLPKMRLIKGLPVREADDVAKAANYQDVADMFLFDAKAPDKAELPGGNGLAFDWALLKNRNFSRPWMLSGGLNADNLEQAVSTTQAPIVDVSSGVESAPGVKDPALIHAFAKVASSL
jgi:phosphoribosylanthranilate isomerase